LTGIWKGYFITNDGQQYKLEFQVKQNKSLAITGVSYSYLDIRFYGKATMSGSLNKTDNQFQVQELRTVEVKNTEGGGTCLMKYLFTYAKSGKEEFLEGTFIGRGEDRANPKNDGNWGDCGGGKVYLRRVQSSDFYVEPFLRDNPKPRIDNSKPKISSPVTKSPPPVIKKKPPVKTNPTTRTKPPVKNPVVTIRKKPTIIKPTPIIDSAKETRVNTAIKNPIPERKIITPEILKTRENALAKTITVNTEDVSIRLYDNGEIDGDSISVFVDKKLTLSHKGLSTVPITLKLKFDEDNTEHEVIMVAENLGRIPPNTSLMIIDAGDKRYQVQITSTEQKNALVRFKYEKPSQ
ncbi:MAG TPA: hypothetical protein VGI82_12975, partial [Chitinophagaceae bacterium]